MSDVHPGKTGVISNQTIKYFRSFAEAMLNYQHAMIRYYLIDLIIQIYLGKISLCTCNLGIVYYICMEFDIFIP